MTLASTYELVRAIVGDFHATYQRYGDSDILGVQRVVVLTGKLPGFTLNPARTEITPDLSEPRDWGLLLYHTALGLVAPQAAAYAYTRRELSERFGEQGLFLARLNEQLFELENPECFASSQTLAGFLNGMTGLNIYAQGTALVVNAPYETATVSRTGITMSSG